MTRTSCFGRSFKFAALLTECGLSDHDLMICPGHTGFESRRVSVGESQAHWQLPGPPPGPGSLGLFSLAEQDSDRILPGILDRQSRRLGFKS